VGQGEGGITGAGGAWLCK